MRRKKQALAFLVFSEPYLVHNCCQNIYGIKTELPGSYGFVFTNLFLN